jgi:hypothetical protein
LTGSLKVLKEDIDIVFQSGAGISPPQGLNWKWWKTILGVFLSSIAMWIMGGSAFFHSTKLLFQDCPDG